MIIIEGWMGRLIPWCRYFIFTHAVLRYWWPCHTVFDIKMIFTLDIGCCRRQPLSLAADYGQLIRYLLCHATADTILQPVRRRFDALLMSLRHVSAVDGWLLISLRWPPLPLGWYYAFIKVITSITYAMPLAYAISQYYHWLLHYFAYFHYDYSFCH